MIHVDIVVVHQFKDEFVLFSWLGNFSDTVTITIFLNLNTIHLHLEGVMYVPDIIPCSFNS